MKPQVMGLAILGAGSLMSVATGHATPFLTAQVTQTVSGAGGCTQAASGLPGGPPTVADCAEQIFEGASLFGGSARVDSGAIASFDGLGLVAAASGAAANFEINASASGLVSSHDDLTVFSLLGVSGFASFHGSLTGSVGGTAPGHPFATAAASAIYEIRSLTAGFVLCEAAWPVPSSGGLTCTLTVPVIFGHPFELIQNLQATASVTHVRGTLGSLDFGSANADFFNTAKITSVALFDSDMNPLVGGSIASASG